MVATLAIIVGILLVWTARSVRKYTDNRDLYNHVNNRRNKCSPE